MNEIVEQLLKPVSPGQPCGPDLVYDPRFEELENLVKGKPEVEIGSVKRPPEPPEWVELRDLSLEFLKHCKHLRVVILWCCSSLKVDGLPGFRDSLQFVQKLLENHWATLHPLLDPEDNSDPTQRLNILGGLTAARGSLAGWLTVIDYLYVAPICQMKGTPPITFDQLQSAQSKTGGVDPVKLASALRGPGAGQTAESLRALEESLEAARGIDQFLTTTLGSGNTISFEVLHKTLQEMIAGIQACLPGGAGLAQSPSAASPASGEPATGGIQVTGSVRTREDVVRAIDVICEYYRQVEPSSAVPYLLRRAQKLATMDFVQAMQELNLANVDSLRPSMGSAVDSGTPPAA